MSFKQEIVKRLFDLFLAAFGGVLLSPIILLCIVVARYDTRSSGLFLQRRVGRNGRCFTVYKIRTMVDDATQSGNTVTTASDIRITKVGRRLRTLKFDELPQLWNVFLGDMSFVGPRPDVPGYADTLSGGDREVLNMRPGITGPATIKYRNEESILECSTNPLWLNNNVIYPDKVTINLNYMNSWTLLKDLQYILMTLKVTRIPMELSVDVDAYCDLN